MDAGRCEVNETGQRMGHEFIGVVDAIGAEVRTVKCGDVANAVFTPTGEQPIVVEASRWQFRSRLVA